MKKMRFESTTFLKQHTAIHLEILSQQQRSEFETQFVSRKKRGRENEERREMPRRAFFVTTES